jgi:choline dehydrogenase-like flavoprotein
VILERSGIGDGARLNGLGIDCAVHSPGVGENLQDHLQIRPVYKVHGIQTLNTVYHNLLKRALMGLDYAFRRRGPLTMAPSQVGAFVRATPEVETANLEFHFQPLSLDNWGEGLHRFSAVTASVCNLRPTSRGSVHAAGPGPDDPPQIDPNYLATDEDRRLAVIALRWARRIMAQPPLAPYRPEEYRPGGRASGSGRRPRDDDLPSRRHGADGGRPGLDGRPRRAASGARCRRPSRCRRLRDADHHLRQHQRAHDDDRREGCGDDPSRRPRRGTIRPTRIGSSG